jgi:hypothetical protein
LGGDSHAEGVMLADLAVGCGICVLEHLVGLVFWSVKYRKILKYWWRIMRN